MQYMKPELTLIEEAISTIQASNFKAGIFAEIRAPYLFVSAAAYEADE